MFVVSQYLHVGHSCVKCIPKLLQNFNLLQHKKYCKTSCVQAEYDEKLGFLKTGKQIKMHK